MTIPQYVASQALKGLTGIICRVDDVELAKVPARGPLILVANHINFIDSPLIYTRLHPRPVTGFAKVETWDNPAIGFLFSLFGAIPIRRGEADMAALRQGLQALAAGRILGVAPEGTRSGDGQLRRGYAGVVTLALRSGAPILPLAHYGEEAVRHNISRLRRTNFSIAVGRPFTLSTEGVKVTREVRQQMMDEIMYELAALLPPAYRGYYANPAASGRTYLYFGPEAAMHRTQATITFEEDL